MQAHPCGNISSGRRDYAVTHFPNTAGRSASNDIRHNANEGDVEQGGNASERLRGVEGDVSNGGVQVRETLSPGNEDEDSSRSGENNEDKKEDDESRLKKESQNDDKDGDIDVYRTSTKGEYKSVDHDGCEGEVNSIAEDGISGLRSTNLSGVSPLCFMVELNCSTAHSSLTGTTSDLLSCINNIIIMYVGYFFTFCHRSPSFFRISFLTFPFCLYLCFHVLFQILFTQFLIDFNCPFLSFLFEGCTEANKYYLSPSDLELFSASDSNLSEGTQYQDKTIITIWY